MTKTILVLMAAFVVLLAGCTGAPQQGGQATGQPSGGSSGGAPSGGTSGGSSGSGSSGMGVDECVVNCNILSDTGMVNTCKAGCYIDAAETGMDASKCDPISQLQNMSIYYATCLGTVAGKAQDIAPCRKLTDVGDKDFCISIAADDYKNPAICEEINNSIYKAVCVDDTTGQ